MGTSANSGFLAPPSSTSNELVGLSLDVLLQTVVQGITSIPGQFVRPRWQIDPPDIPDILTDWVSVGRLKRVSDVFSFIRHDPVANNGNGQDIVYRNEILDILCSFYGPNAELNAERLSLGFQVAQNRELLQVNSYGLVEVQDIITTSDLVHERWRTRVDVGFRLRRGQLYTYPVLNIIEVPGVVISDDGFITLFDSNTSSGSASLPLFAWDLPNSTILGGWDVGDWS